MQPTLINLTQSTWPCSGWDLVALLAYSLRLFRLKSALVKAMPGMQE